ncbi:MAG TPA: DUF4365 domain-containing protein [Candidatus Acidoferrales bacterium]|nr:DUF4365 domain-containing protein [Candidatus Acidoferrales bacterium]
MPTEKTQSRAIHIGNVGEHHLAAQLARHCIVRDVGQGKDTGIDLYCEILQPGSRRLSLHFFCQVKTQKADISLGSIEDKFWTYWGDQPVPVFLFLIKYTDEDKIQDDSEIWVYDVPYMLAKKDAQGANLPEPQRDLSDRFLITSESNNRDKMKLGDFLNRHVPWSYGLWHMRRFGLVLPNPKVVETPAQVLVGGFSYIYQQKIRDAIQWANWLLENESQKDARE